MRRILTSNRWAKQMVWKRSEGRKTKIKTRHTCRTRQSDLAQVAWRGRNQSPFADDGQWWGSYFPQIRWKIEFQQQKCSRKERYLLSDSFANQLVRGIINTIIENTPQVMETPKTDVQSTLPLPRPWWEPWIASKSPEPCREAVFL